MKAPSSSSDKRAELGIALLVPICFAVIVLGASVGSVAVSFSDTAAVIASKLFGLRLPGGITDATASIVWNMRLPRVLLAFLTGAGMSAGGAITQSVLHNPLASPYTLGVSSGASVGAAIVTVYGISLSFANQLSLALVGTVFGILTVVICIVIASRADRNLGSTTLVLFGMVLSLFLSAMFTFIAGTSRDKMTLLLRWQMGSFGSKGWESAGVLFIVFAVCFTVILFFGKELDILSFSDESAMSIGVNVKGIKWLLLILTAILTSTAVSFAGVIGFVDLIAPHAARKLFSPKHKYLLTTSALMGGGFMVIADLAARTLTSPVELPVGAVTALIGAPFFAYIYFSGGGGRRRA